MSTYTTSAQTRGFGLAFAVSSVLSSLLVVVKETNEGLLNFMKAVTVHHWMTHGVFNLIVFVALGLLFSKSNNGLGPNIDDEKLIKVIVGGFLVGAAIVVAFYGVFD